MESYNPAPELRETKLKASPAASYDAVDQISDTIGQLMEFWGFKHIMGRTWTVLFLSPKPLSAPELIDRLGVSSGAVSMALRDLLTWGAIRKVCPKDSRKDHYIAEDNIWKMISRVLSEREGRRIESTLNNLQEAIDQLQTSHQAKQETNKNISEIHFQIKRLEELRKLGNIGRQLLKLLLLRAKVDVRPLQESFQNSHPSHSPNDLNERPNP